MKKDHHPFTRALRRLMAEHPQLGTARAIEARCLRVRHPVGYATIVRAKNGTGNPTQSTQDGIAAAFGLTVEEVLALDPMREQEKVAPQRTAPLPPSAVRLYDVRLFPFAELAVSTAILRKQATDELIASSIGGPGIIATRQADDSMQRPDGPSIPAGTLLVLDLDASPKPGDLVVVRIARKCYLRQLVDDAGGRRLIPFNPRFASIEAPADPQDYVGVLRKTVLETDWS